MCKSYYSDTTLLSVRSISGHNEQFLLDAFADTLVASHMRLHVSDDTLTTHLITWTGVKLCSDLHYTLNDDWMPPQAVIGWLLATKLRTGPLRLYVHITASEDFYGNWERSLQKLLKVRSMRLYPTLCNNLRDFATSTIIIPRSTASSSTREPAG